MQQSNVDTVIGETLPPVPPVGDVGTGTSDMDAAAGVTDPGTAQIAESEINIEAEAGEKAQTNLIDWRDRNDLGLWEDNMATQICDWWLEKGSKDCQHKDSDFKDNVVKKSQRSLCGTVSLRISLEFTHILMKTSSARDFVTRLQPVDCIALLANWLVNSQMHSQVVSTIGGRARKSYRDMKIVCPTVMQWLH